MFNLKSGLNLLSHSKVLSNQVKSLMISFFVFTVLCFSAHLKAEQLQILMTEPGGIDAETGQSEVVILNPNAVVDYSFTPYGVKLSYVDSDGHNQDIKLSFKMDLENEQTLTKENYSQLALIYSELSQHGGLILKAHLKSKALLNKARAVQEQIISVLNFRHSTQLGFLVNRSYDITEVQIGEMSDQSGVKKFSNLSRLMIQTLLESHKRQERSLLAERNSERPVEVPTEKPQEKKAEKSAMGLKCADLFK